MKKLVPFVILIFLLGCGKDINETTITRKITIQGEVINSSQRPLGDVTVSLFVGNQKVNETTSQGNGNFQFSVDESDFEKEIIVQAQKEGFAKNGKSVKSYSEDLAFVFLTMHKSETNSQECNGDLNQNGLVSVSGYILDQNSNPAKGEVIFQDNDDVEIIGYTDKEGQYEVFVSPTKSYTVTYSTNCLSELVERWGDPDPEMNQSGIGPVENYRFLKENSFPESFTMPAYFVKSSLQEFKIAGTAISCEGTPITEGRVIFEEFWEIPIIDGQIELTTFDCFEIKDAYTFIIEDLANSMTSTILTKSVNGNNIHLGVIQTCESMIQSAELTIDQDTNVFSYGFIYPDETNGYINQGEFVRAPAITLEKEGLIYKITSHADEVGSFESHIYKFSNNETIRYSNTNDLSINYTEFGFKEFYGESKGTIDGNFLNHNTNEVISITGAFTVRTIPNFGEY